MAEGAARVQPSRAWLAAVAFAGHTPGLWLLARCRFTPALVRVNVAAALLTVLAMVAAGVTAEPGRGAWAVVVAWLWGHFAWSTIFAAWILRGGAIVVRDPSRR
ncbi:MAG: hypothetical protein KDK70_12460 [Myxococcales bacterium]|nr:hypothetical protein [Myxococcales bacterium]